MKIYLASLGCKLNESELEAWARQFIARGDEIVTDEGLADQIIVNTCTVTAQAARKSRALVRQLGRSNSQAQVVLTGCYATLSPEQARALPNVSFLVPNQAKDKLVQLMAADTRLMDHQLSQSGCRMPEAASGNLIESAENLVETKDLKRNYLLDNPALGTVSLRTRAFVKIEDGCNMSCAYCIIPLARGRARSRPQDQIIHQVQELVEAGYQEVILTGVQISDYELEKREGFNGGSTSARRLRGLCELVTGILEQTALPRLRLTSIAPWDLEDELLELFSDKRLCRHLHLSLQSGSTSVLRRMRRPYTAEQFTFAVERAKSRIPNVAITTDVIVGFPGETEEENEDSVSLVKQMKFARIHVFPYSSREGTLASHLPNHLPGSVKDARMRIMQSVADESATQFANQYVGVTLSVLYEESSRVSGTWSGYTDNYLRVQTRSRENLANHILPTRILENSSDGILGELESARVPLLGL